MDNVKPNKIFTATEKKMNDILMRQLPKKKWQGTENVS